MLTNETDETPPSLTWSASLSPRAAAAESPCDLLAAACGDWDDSSAACLALLTEFAGGRCDLAPEAFLVVHLCGEKGETRAYPILCRLIAEDREIASWLDDAVTESLPGILIRVFDGNAEPLRRAVESVQGDEFARASALAALGWLVREKSAMTDKAMRAWLRRIARKMAPRRDSVIWMTWAATVASLGYEDMRSEVAALRRNDFIPAGDFSNAEFDLRIELARSDDSGLAAFAHDLIAPLADADAAVSRFAAARGAAAGRQLISVAETINARPI
jgi:hypothetical protein